MSTEVKFFAGLMLAVALASKILPLVTQQPAARLDYYLAMLWLPPLLAVTVRLWTR